MPRHARRLTFVLVFMLLASLGLPASALPGSWSLALLAWRVSFLDTAAAFAGLPQQQTGPGDANGPQERRKRPSLAPPRLNVPAWESKGVPGAHSFDPARSTRVQGEGNQWTNVYNNPDGSQTVRQSTGRVNYKDSQGIWRPIDTNLVRTANGRLRGVASDLGVSLWAPNRSTGVLAGDEGNGQRRLTEELAAITLPGGQVFGFGLQGAVAVAPRVRDNSATYGEIVPGVDVEIVAQETGLKENLVLKDRSAARQFVFPLRLQGLTPRLSADGSLELLDSSGKVAGVVPRPFMHDSAPVDESGEHRKSYDVSYSLVEVEGSPALVVTAGNTWLDDPARVWPVVFDPTLNTADMADVYVDTEASTHEADQNGNSLALGRWSAGGIARSFMAFHDFDTNGFVGKRITSVNLNVYLTWANTCNVYETFYVHMVNTSWSVTALQDANLSASPSYSASIGGGTITDHTPACTNTSGNRSVGEWHSVPLTSSVFSDWASNRGPGHWDYGLALTASETSNTSWKRFTSANYGATYKPYLSITFANNVAPQVDDLYPPSGSQVKTLTPQLAADGYDSDGFPGVLSYNFEIFEETPVAGTSNTVQAKIGESGWTSSKTWTVPAGMLKWGGRYRWQARTNDGLVNAGIPSTDWDPSWRWVLTTPVPQGPITSTLGSNGKAGFTAGSGSYTTEAVDAQVATVGPPLEVSRSYHSLDPRTTGAFGAGWSSLLDVKATERRDFLGTNVITVDVTYPTGQTVAYGNNGNGTYSAGLGRYAGFTSVAGGYQLVDKDGTKYLFTTLAGTGVYALTSVTDVYGRMLNLTYTAGKVTKLTSASSGRNLHITWTGTHVSSVTTDEAVLGVPSSAATWTYTYVGDQLTNVCTPISGTECATYSYTDSNLFAATMENLDPYSYWRLDEASGTQAASQSADRMGVDVGSYSNVTLGQPGPVAGSAATAAGFNGTSSSVNLPVTMASRSGYQTISMWFKASSLTDQVLYGQSWDPLTSSVTHSPYKPILYMGSSGQLYGSFPTMPTTGPVGSFVGGPSGRCMDSESNGDANGRKVWLFDCNGAGSQQWTLTATGELRFTHGSYTRCLQENGPETGARMSVWDCTGAASQKWRLTADGRVVSQESGHCIDVNNGLLTNGAEIVMWRCYQPYYGHQTFTPRTFSPMGTSTPLAAGQWYHVVLTAAGDRQTLYVNGAQVGSQTGITIADVLPKYQHVGAGFLGGGWPNQSHIDPNRNSGVPDWFDGSISDVALFDRPFTADQINELYNARTPRKMLSQVARASGRITATVGYDPETGKVQQVTDANGGVWKLNPPVVKGSSQVYVSSVLGSVPVDYWRLTDMPGATAPRNQINANVAVYNGPVLGGANPVGPFQDTIAPAFDGVDDFVSAVDATEAAGPTGSSVNTAAAFSASMWVNLTNNAVSRQALAIPGVNSSAFSLGYDKASNKWAASMCLTDTVGATCPRVTSTQTASTSAWTHLAASLDMPSKTLRLYVNGALQGSTVLASNPWTANRPLVMGKGLCSGVDCDWWAGNLAEVATFGRKLSDQEIGAQFTIGNEYRANPNAVAMPAKVVSMVDPTEKVSTQVFGLSSGQQIATTDTLGNQTDFGYDVASGVMTVMVDPNGNMTDYLYDVRGNVVEQSTWQDHTQPTVKSTTRFTYFPDATTKFLSADPRNNKVLTVRDARSASAADNTYLTTNVYDVGGNLVEQVDPLGRKTTATYTDGTGGVPAGLLTKQTTPGGAVTLTAYLPSGDIDAVTDPGGKVTQFTYDLLGRPLTQKVTTSLFPAGLTTSYAYDKQNRLTSMTEPATTNRVTGAVHTPVTVTVYNPDGQVMSVVASDATGGDAFRTESYAYNALGQKISHTDASNKTTSYTYDLYGQVLTTTDPAGTVLEVTRDSEGQLRTTKFKDFTGDPDSPSTPVDVAARVRDYDSGGRLIGETDAMGWVHEYTYTDNNLLKTVTRVDGVKRFVLENNTYDKAGNLIQQVANDGATTTTFAVDAASRTTSSTLDPSGLNRTTILRYSTDDQVASIVIKDATTVHSREEAVYDKAGGLLSTVKYTGTGTSPLARWNLNETSGSVAGDTVGNNNITASNVTWSSDHGGSAVFGATSNASANGPVLDTAQSFTISAWVRLDDKTQHRVIASQCGVNLCAFYLQYSLSYDRWVFKSTTADDQTGVTVPAQSNNPPTLGQWTHLAGVYDAAAQKLTLYVNGEAQSGPQSNVKIWPSSGKFHIGRHLTEDSRFAGAISDVQAYQQALTAAEVSQVHAGAAQEQNWNAYRDYTSGDFNQDGKADLLAIRISDGVMVRWSGNGDGTFAYAGNVSGGWSTYRELVSADFNNDGKVDLMALSSADNKLRRWFGSGAGVFQASQEVSAGWSGMVNMVAADFTSDGKADMMGIDSTNGNQRCYWGNGAGGFSSSTTCGSGWTGLRELVAGDYSADGKADLMAINASNTLKRWNGDGAGGTPGTGVDIGTGWAGFHNLVAGDFNTDGKVDLYALRPDGNVGRYQNTGTGNFTNIGSLTAVTGSYPAATAKVLRTSLVRDQSGVAVSQTDPSGNITSFQYDEAFRLAVTLPPAVTSEEHGTSPVVAIPMSSNGYNTFGEQTQSKDALGNVVTAGYDANGRIVSTTYPSYTPPGSPTPIVPVSTRVFDSIGQLTKEIDPLGHETTFVYDMLGRVTKQTNPDGGVARYTYDLAGDTLSVTDPSGATQTATYDYLGRQLTGTQIVRQTSSNHITNYTYGTGGWLSKVTSPNGLETRYTYNTAGQIATIADAANATTTYHYDPAGRPTKTVLADNTFTTTGYDLAGRALSHNSYDASSALLHTVTASYDRNGNMLSTTDGRGTTQTFTYDATNLLTSQTEPLSGSESIVSTFGYNGLGQPTRFTDGRNNAFWTTYNRLGLVESQIEPATAAHPNLADRTFTTSYNAAGLPITQTLPGGVSQSHSYDAMGRITQSSGSGAQATTANRTFGYDLAGRMTSLSGSGGTNTLTWDDRSLPLTIEGPSGNNTFTYTADGMMSNRIDAAGTTTYSYDNAGRLSTIANAANGVQALIAYNTLSQPTQITYGTSQNRRAFGYDSLHRLTSDELKTSGGALIGKITYGYDANSNLTAKTAVGFAGGAVNTYTYDLANRLTSWNNGSTTANYAYDKSGNRTQAGTKTFTYDERSRLWASPSDGVTYQYTARGTLAQTTTGTVVRQTHTDAFDQVARQYTSDTAYAEYTYDGLGRAIKPGFAYTGLGNDLAADGSASYTRDPVGDLVGVKQGGSGVLAWTDIHTDVVGQFTATDTTLAGSKTFDPLGKVVAASGSVGNLGYQQEYTEAATGRVNMHARWYDPETGQFDTRDSWDLSPVGNSANANRYGYGNANPLSGTDPTGHEIMSGCNNVFSCLAQGFVNSFDLIGAFNAFKAVIKDPGGAIKAAINGIKAEAERWRITINNKIRDLVDCGDFWWIGLEGVCNDVVNIGATVGGWACALSGACQLVYDCMAVIGVGKGNVNECAKAAGELLADGVKALVSAGAGAVVSKIASKVTSMLKRFGLPDKRNDHDDSNGNGNGNGNGRDSGDDISAEKNYMRSHPTSPPKKSGNGKGNSGKGGSGKGKGGSSNKGSSGCKGSSCKTKTTSNDSDGNKKSDEAEARKNSPEANSKVGRDKNDDGNGCSKHSFDPSTKVLMADGSAKAIGGVRLGEKVAATDPATGVTTAQPVTALHVNLDRELTDVTVRAVNEGEGDRSTRGPTTTLETTQNHPFWEATSGAWAQAKDLKAGESTLTGPDGQLLEVVAVRNFVGAAAMRDLTVATIHTYHVIAGDKPVLVHNNDPGFISLDFEGGESCPIKPGAYTTAFEMTLDFKDFGRGDSVQFNRANAALDAAIQSDSNFADLVEELIPGVSNSVSSKGRRDTPKGWTWHHAPISNTPGQVGVMRLVPIVEHSAGSPLWKLLHPDGYGGYAEWAIPNGAPDRKKKKKR